MQKATGRKERIGLRRDSRFRGRVFMVGVEEEVCVMGMMGMRLLCLFFLCWYMRGC